MAAEDDTEAQEAISRVYKTFILENSMPEIIQILREDEVDMHYSIITDCTALLKIDMTLADLLFFHSDKALKVLDNTLAIVCKEVFGSHALKLQMTLKPNLHARIRNIPICPELWRDRVPKSKDIGKFLAVEGTVIRTSSVKLLEYEKELTCAKCQSVFTLEANFEQHYRITTPSRCPVRASCNSKKFIMTSHDGTSGGRKCKDFQEIKIQEQMRRLAMGTIPRVITVVLEDDLVDGCKPGDDVVIFGALQCRWQPLQLGKACNLELVLKANNIEVRNEQRLGASVKEEMQNDFECFWAAHAESPMVARNHILASLCPQIYGLYVVKLAVALVLAGGVPRTDSSGSRVRGEAHLLLVGDPGTGKSQFLKYASKITPRSVLTTGIGSTSAGLTVTAIRDGPHWTLEAGALVLADGGICCIDELSSIKEHDRGAIHEAMEQQTVSVAKAGLVCKLNTRTSVLAATNPKLGKYDESSSIDLNVAIASPLLSRFDMVLVLLDAKNELWDSVVADYVLTGKDVMNNNRGKQKLWSMERMQAYFCVVKQINPVLTPSANRIISEYYRCHRRSDFRNAARTTIRLLESLIRIAEAHARLMYRQTVEVLDAVAAVTIMESSMQGASLLPTGSILHSCFPDDPEEEYKMHAKVVLNRLELDEILQEEIASSPVKATSLNRSTSFIPPESPFESKVFNVFSLKPDSPKQRPQTAANDGGSNISTHRVVATSHRPEDFENSINIHNIFDASHIERLPTDAGTSTQKPPLVKIHPVKKWGVDKAVKPGNDFCVFETLGTENSPGNASTTTNNHQSENVAPVKIHPQKQLNKPTIASTEHDFRSRLLCFKHVTPDSSPERDIQLTGIISHGNRKENNSKANANLLNFSSKTYEENSDLFNNRNQAELPMSTFQTSTQSTSVSVDFGGEISNVLLDRDSPRPRNICDIAQGKKDSNSTTLFGKRSIFSLNATEVEEICDEFAFNKEDGRFGKGFFEELGNSQFAIPSSLQEKNPTTSVDGSKENQPPDDARFSQLFRINDTDDDFENWGAATGNDLFDFSVDWSVSQDNFGTKKRKTEP